MPKRLSDEIASRVRALIEEQTGKRAALKCSAERQLALQLSGINTQLLREALAVSEGVLRAVAAAGHCPLAARNPARTEYRAPL